jgi:hypothetical protein
MTEDYLRRVIPTKWAVDIAKLQERNVTDIISVLFCNLEMWRFMLPGF